MAKSKYKVANMADLPDEQQIKEPHSAKATRGKEAYKSKKSAKKAEPDFGESSLETVEITPDAEIVAKEDTIEEVAETKPEKKIGFRSKRYTSSKSHIDRTKTYALKEAVKLLKETATAKFDETVEVHLVTKDVLGNVEVSYPHSTGKVIRVQIVTDDVISGLDKAQIDFDVLLATPAQMGKLTKYARLLGPKGLMPNPKNGTLIADPEKRKKELESGKTTVRGEKKSPLVHTTVGKISMDEKALVGNIQALLDATQGKTLKAVITSTMSPGIKVQI